MFDTYIPYLIGLKLVEEKDIIIIASFIRHLIIELKT